VSAGGEIDRLRVELDDLFSEAWRRPAPVERRAFHPAIDCFRTAEPPELVVVVELAGVDPDAIRLVAAEGTLVVAGERRRRKAERGSRVYEQLEIGYGSFERRVVLAEDVATDGAAATYEHGLLKVVFPVVGEPSRPTHVPIEVRRA
jgi:HSP20 family protein